MARIHEVQLKGRIYECNRSDDAEIFFIHRLREESIYAWLGLPEGAKLLEIAAAADREITGTTPKRFVPKQRAAQKTNHTQN